MCAGAMVHARVMRLVYGAADARAGAAGSIYNVVEDRRLNHQIEVVGKVLLERKSELLEAMGIERERRSLQLYALMVTDILTKGTDLLIAGDTAAVARTFGVQPEDGVIELPGVMSRKKEVAPKLLSAL